MGEGIRRAGLLAALGFALGFVLSGCVSIPFVGGGHQALNPHPTYKVGAPYTVKGVTYYPHVDYDYDQTGLASWYGQAFQGQYTANGEIFDLNQLTAAHTTLPLPTIVEVVNLQNNRALRIRVNDRGPFVRGRIIDLSRRAAQLLGFESTGTALVRVRVLKEDSIRAAALAQHGRISEDDNPVAQIAASPEPRFLVESSRYHTEAGPVATEAEARRLLTRMIASGYRDARIVFD
ncbi:MAG TPA: septal ring lytic transglycosylase RlpA family protein [Stellaceae bacterium]|nr:septal ring lytic transglycosylase RlpA family protein [Stellaceae bacterium]